MSMEWYRERGNINTLAVLVLVLVLGLVFMR